MSRFARHLNQDTLTLAKSPKEKINLLKTAFETSLYIGKNPIRALKEANAIAESEDYTGLEIFKNAGIKIGMIQGEQDKLTPAKKLWSRIGKGYGGFWERFKIGEQYKPFDEPPPFDVITMVGGGHDNRIYGERDFAKKVLNQLSLLNHPKVEAQA